MRSIIIDNFQLSSFISHLSTFISHLYKCFAFKKTCWLGIIPQAVSALATLRLSSFIFHLSSFNFHLSSLNLKTQPHHALPLSHLPRVQGTQQMEHHLPLVWAPWQVLPLYRHRHHAPRRRPPVRALQPPLQLRVPPAAADGGPPLIPPRGEDRDACSSLPLWEGGGRGRIL